MQEFSAAELRQRGKRAREAVREQMCVVVGLSAQNGAGDSYLNTESLDVFKQGGNLL